jgi:hypothetical protein
MSLILSEFCASLNALATLTRMPTQTTIKRSPSVQAARNALRSKGWTQAAAAQVLGITPIHLCYVLNGRRESRRVLTAIQHLPTNPNPA